MQYLLNYRYLQFKTNRPYRHKIKNHSYVSFFYLKSFAYRPQKKRIVKSNMTQNARKKGGLALNTLWMSQRYHTVYYNTLNCY